MSYAAIQESCVLHGLDVLGGFYSVAADEAPAACQTLLLLGPAKGFWSVFAQSAESNDGAADPVDRWSQRVIGALAAEFNGQALFPFGGPPYTPFISWALRSGRAWTSPVGILVHDTAGLLISYRGALALPVKLPLPDLPKFTPCETCLLKPCLNACPVAALSIDGYDVPACQSFLSSAPGRNCLDNGCAVRNICPISKNLGRLPEQSTHHMRYFYKT